MNACVVYRGIRAAMSPNDTRPPAVIAELAPAATAIIQSSGARTRAGPRSISTKPGPASRVDRDARRGG